MSFPVDLSGNIFSLSFTGAALAHFAFFIISAFAATMSVVFFYHWKKYSRGGAVMAVAEISYVLVSIILLATAFFALPSF